MAQIFISYSRKDVDFARKLAASLSDLGAEVWIDVEDIPVGMNWSRAIQQGLDQCDVLLLIMSPDSMNSRNVENEWQYVLDQGKAVIPIRWRPAKPHFQLNRLQYHDFHNRDYNQSFRSLHYSLIYQGVDLPAVKGQSTTPASPHSAPFLEDASTEDTSTSRGLKRRWIMSILSAIVLIIALALGANAVRDNGDDDSSDSDSDNFRSSESIAAIIETRDDIQTISQIASGVEALRSAGDFTFFAPADAYLAEQGLEESLITAFRDDFEYLIELHVVEGSYTYDELSQMDGENLTTLAGTELTITYAPPAVLINDDPILVGDIEASNGVVHILDGFLGSP